MCTSILKLVMGVKEVVNNTLTVIDELWNSPGTTYMHKDNYDLIF